MRCSTRRLSRSREHVARDPEALLELVETAPAEEDVTNDQERPALAHHFERTRDRAILALVVASQHVANGIRVSCVKQLDVIAFGLSVALRNSVRRREMTSLQNARGRRTLSNQAAYVLVAGIIGLGLFASVTPSPLYRTYSVLWHFSPLTLTLIYATYAFGSPRRIAVRRRRVGRCGPPPGSARRPQRPGWLDRPVPARRLGGLAVRCPRPAGACDRRSAGRCERVAPRPPPAP